MMLTMFIVLGVVMLGVSISLYEVLRNSRPFGWFIMLVDTSPLTQFAFHFLISLVILTFSGEGAIAGVANLATSIVFTFYCMARNVINPAYKAVNGGKIYRRIRRG